MTTDPPATCETSGNPIADSVAQRSFASLKWSTLGELLSRSLLPLVVLIIGSRLDPGEFGLLGIATIALGIAQQLQDAGLNKTLIQTSEDLDSVSSMVFWINLALSTLLFLVLLVLAPTIGEIFHRPDSAAVLRALGCRLVLLALGVVQLTRLQRELRFRVIFGARLASSLASVAVIIPLALSGYRVWSLVWGMVAGAAVQTVWLWTGSSWRPKWSWNTRIFSKLLGFSRWVLLETVLGLVVNWTDSVIVGRYLGDIALGKYRLAASALALTSGLLLQPMLPVALSAFAKLKGEWEVKEMHQLLTRLALMITGAQAVLLLFLAPGLVNLFLSSKWSGTAPLLFLLAFKLMIDWISGFNSQAFTAAGRPDLVAKQLLVVAVVTIPLMIFSAPHGAEALAATRVAVAGVDSTISVALAGMMLGLGFRHVWVPLLPALGASFATGLILWMLRSLPCSATQRLILGLIIGPMVYLSAWNWLVPGGVRTLLNTMFKRPNVATSKQV